MQSHLTTVWWLGVRQEGLGDPWRHCGFQNGSRQCSDSELTLFRRAQKKRSARARCGCWWQQDRKQRCTDSPARPADCWHQNKQTEEISCGSVSANSCRPSPAPRPQTWQEQLSGEGKGGSTGPGWVTPRDRTDTNGNKTSASSNRL